MPADYHSHTPLCHHAVGTPEAYVDAAIKQGLSAYGISDHAPVGEAYFDDWRMLYDKMPEYFSWIDAAKKGGPAVSGHHSGLFKIDPEPSVRLGTEAMTAAVIELLKP